MHWVREKLTTELGETMKCYPTKILGYMVDEGDKCRQFPVRSHNIVRIRFGNFCRPPG